jgi:hypothetical protein
MYTIQLNPARLYNCYFCTAQTHENIKIERRQMSSVRSADLGSLDSRHVYESNKTLHFSFTCISKKMYETRTDQWHTAWNNPRVPFLGVDTEQDFHPVDSSFHQTHKADKIRSSYLSIGRRALFPYKEPEGQLL